MRDKFTKGPWTVQRSATKFRLLDPDGSVLSINGGMVPIEADANLIATAPDLYEALESVLLDGRDWLSDEACERLESALRKARGELSATTGLNASK